MSVMGTLRGVFLLLSFFPQYLWKLYFPKFDTVLLADFLLPFTLSLLGIYYHPLPYHINHIPYPTLFLFLIPLFSIGSFNVFTMSYTIKWGKVGNCGKFLYFSSFSQLYSLSITYFTFFWVLWVKWGILLVYYYSIYYYYLSSIYYQQYYYIVLFFLCLFPTHSLRSFVRSSA